MERTVPLRRAAAGMMLVPLGVVLLAAPVAQAGRPGSTEKVSLSSDGSDPSTESGNWLSSHVSRDGRYVIFESAERLVPQDRGNTQDIYVRDRKTGTVRLVSVGSDGTQGPLSVIAGSWTPAVTPNGRFVAFYTLNPLVPGDTNAATDIYVRDIKTGSTERVSVDSDGNQSLPPPLDLAASEPSISDDGRYVAFNSNASDLAEGDTNDSPDIFVHDRRTGKTERVSVAGDGRQAEGTSGWANISGNGRFVVFQNGDTTLDLDYTGALAGLYMRDLRTGTTEFTVAGAGIPDADGKIISSDGRFITFNSFWNFFVPNDTNVMPLHGIDIFVYDHKTKRVERASVTSFGEEVFHSSTDPKISGDGRYVSFESQADDLVDGDTSPEPWPNTDVESFLYDRMSGMTEMISVTPEGAEPSLCPDIRTISQSSFDPAVSWDGRFVSYVSCADGLDGRDSNRSHDVFVRDRGLDVGVGGYGSVGTPAMAGWPGFGHRGLQVIEDPYSDVAVVGRGRGAEILWGSISYRSAFDDLFIKVDVDRIPGPRGGIDGLPAAGDPSILYGAEVIAGGVAFEVRVAKQSAQAGEAEFGLFRCARSSLSGPAELLAVATADCTQVSELRGGYGTVGDNVVVAVPLRELGVETVAEVESVDVFIALGSYREGARELLDLLGVARKSSALGLEQGRTSGR